MKFKLDERGFVLAEFAIALPLLILLLYSLGMVTFSAWKIAREQVADYALETEAQYVIDRIAADARAAYSVDITKATGNQELYNIIFKYNNLFNETVGANTGGETSIESYKKVLDTRRYAVAATKTHGHYVYARRTDNDYNSSPITGGNFYGDTVVTELKYSISPKKILHITLEMESLVTHRKVRLNTAVFIPAYEPSSDE